MRAARFVGEEIGLTAGVVEVAGARALLARLAAIGMPTALVTGATRALAETRMEAAGLPLPAVTVTCEDTVRGKPAPDGDLLAARRLGVDPT